MDPISDHLKQFFHDKVLTMDRDINQDFVPGWHWENHPSEASKILISPNDGPTWVLRDQLYYGSSWGGLNRFVEFQIMKWELAHGLRKVNEL